jgi:phosphoribosylanthranilate isomerase
MKIKVCGITSIEQMRELQQLGIDYAGMIFYEGSKRYAKEKLAGSKSEIRDIEIKKIGVFVNADFEFISKTIVEFGLNAVQLHGDETDEFCMDLMDRTTVIKVFRIADQTDIDALVEPFKNACHYYLFDTDTTMYGGSGKQFDWNILQKAKVDKPFFLSGGIGPADVEKIRGFKHPCLYAVDVNSRFETSPGIKDLVAIKQFSKELKDEVSDTTKAK